ncbi:MAG: hypothetical protein DI498_13800 [Paracoccus denitrificans]|nr:MAG: hypothetical protein DI498_13800 [Paracoccus denitrificans]PZO82881.1 MAG: hypothetical protein DI633_13800 [Paracoccus denitrificans]
MWDWWRGYFTAWRHVATTADWINPVTLQVFAAFLSALAGFLAWRVSQRVARQGEWERLFRAQTSARSAALQLHQRAALVSEELRPSFREGKVIAKMRRGPISERGVDEAMHQADGLRKAYTDAAQKYMSSINDQNNAFEIEASKGQIDLDLAKLEFDIAGIKRRLTTEWPIHSDMPWNKDRG